MNIEAKDGRELKPKMLKGYMGLAKAIFNWWEDFHLPCFPLHYRIQHGALATLEKAVHLINELRMPEPELSYSESGDFETNDDYVLWEVQQPWALSACLLWEYVSRLNYVFHNGDFCEKFWPKSPKIEGFGEVGRSAFEVVEFFAVSVGGIMFDALRSACGRNEYQGFVYDFIDEETVTLEPTLEPKAADWLRGAKVGLAEGYPNSEWPERAIEHERRGLACQLEFEAEQAAKTQEETEQKIEPGKEDLLEGIRKAYEEVEKLTETDLNFDKVTNEEINFAEAAVIEYLTRRFGEQDDALGNWPSDWHECPEAFDLYKAKIQEYRANKAKARLDEVRRIAEAHTEPKIKLARQQPEQIPVESKSTPTLNDAEVNIVEALGTKTLTGEKLSVKAGYPYNSNFKSTLSALRKRGILGNKAPGYFVEPDYHFLLKKSD